MVAVNYVGEELWSYFNAPWEKRVDLAWQLMEIAEQLTNNDFEFALYLLDVSFDNFAVGPRDGKVIDPTSESMPPTTRLNHPHYETCHLDTWGPRTEQPWCMHVGLASSL